MMPRLAARITLARLDIKRRVTRTTTLRDANARLRAQMILGTHRNHHDAPTATFSITRGSTRRPDLEH